MTLKFCTIFSAKFCVYKNGLKSKKMMDPMYHVWNVDLFENWTNLPLLMNILITYKVWWMSLRRSKIEVKVALAVKAANSLQKLSKFWTACWGCQTKPRRRLMWKATNLKKRLPDLSYPPKIGRIKRVWWQKLGDRVKPCLLTCIV